MTLGEQRRKALELLAPQPSRHDHSDGGIPHQSGQRFEQAFHHRCRKSVEPIRPMNASVATPSEISSIRMFSNWMLLPKANQQPRCGRSVSGGRATVLSPEVRAVNVAVFDEAADQPKCLLAMLFQNDAGARVTCRLAGLFHRNAGVVPLCCRKPATKRARLLCAAADTSSLPYGHGVSPRSGFLAPAPPFCRGCFFGCGAVAMASDGRSLRRRRAHQKVVRLLYGKCCGQRGGCGHLRICCCWSSNSARFRDSTAASSDGQPRLHGRGSFLPPVIWPFRPRLHRSLDSRGGFGGTRDRSPAHKRGGPPRCPRQQSPERVVRLRGSGR